MSIPAISLTKGDFDQCDWQNVIVISANKRCDDYCRRFINKAAEAKALGDIKAYAVFTLMGEITYPEFKLKNVGNPFLHGEIFNDVSEEHLTMLKELVIGISDPEMQARIADLLWIRTGEYAAVRLAIDAYLAVAHLADDAENWVEWVQRIERPFRLPASADRRQRG